MTYAKPELVTLTHAVEAIQGEPKADFPVESQFPPEELTSAAYEADE